jgi:ABC-2 type transport system ATP-binding protein
VSLLNVEHIHKEYPSGVRANNDVSLSVEAGEIFGLLGPNGAGKTTLVNQIIGLITPTSGRIYLDGVDALANPQHARQACSFQPQSQVPIDGVTMQQAIELVGQLRGGDRSSVRQRASQLIEALEITEWAGSPGETLSGGVRRLTAFCMATVVPGQLVILDEPTNDVDPLRRRLLWREVRNLAEMGSAVLLVTHNVLEAERSVDRLAILDRGRVVGAGTAADLKGHEDGNLRLELTIEPAAGPPVPAPFLSQSVMLGRRMIARLEGGSLDQAVEWASSLKDNGSVEEFSIGPTTLEDAYIRMVGRDDALEVPSAEVNHVATS